MDARGEDGENALEISIQTGNYALFERLLNKGADPNTIGFNGESVLLTALEAAEETDDLTFAFAAELIRRGAEVNEEVSGNRPVFFVAVGAFSVPVVNFLLERGADINKEHGGETPLAAAIQEGQEAIFKFLLRKGAEITPRVREIVKVMPTFAGILADFEALDEIIYTEPLPTGMSPENVYAFANRGKSLKRIRRKMTTLRDKNVASRAGAAGAGAAPRRRKSRRGKTQRQRHCSTRKA
jgi:ankyrin repeat protein